jgi:hypothetical protein
MLRTEGYRAWVFCSPRVEEGGELKNEGKASVRELGNGGGSGGAPAGGARLLRASGTRTCSNTSLISLWRSQEPRRKSGGTNPTPAAAENRGGGAEENWCSSAGGGVLWVQRGGQELERELK